MKKPKPQTLTADTPMGRALPPAGGLVLAAATAYAEGIPADEKAATLRATQRHIRRARP